jgi:hypothetical protein
MSTGCRAVESSISFAALPGAGGDLSSRVEQWRIQVDQLTLRIHDPSQDFVGVEAGLRQLETEIDESIRQSGPETARNLGLLALQNSVRSIVSFMGTDPVRTRAREQEKWVAAGFDRSLITTDPEAVHFAVSSKLIYTIAMFAKSAAFLEGEPMTIKAVNGSAYFKVEGEWKPYSAFKDEIQYSEELYKIVGWNFIHPMGFVHHDWVEYDRIYPIAKLNEAGIRATRAHAQKFWGEDQPEIDPGAEKPCVLQVMTTGREWDGLSKAWWANNLREHFPKHTSLRLMMPDGYLYSFGGKMGLQTDAFLCSSEHQLATGLATVPTPDYEESRRSDDRTMVAVPLTEERAKQILAFANEANKGFSFNFLRQNCVRFADVVLRLGGVKMSSQMSMGQFLADGLPRVSDIPYIGKGIAAIASAVCSVVSPVFHCIGAVVNAVMPYPIKLVWNFVTGAVGEVSSRIAAFVVNGVALTFLGADTSVVPEEQPKISKLESFRQLLTWKDLWTPEAIQVCFSTQLDRWLRAQRNVLIFPKPEYGFCCLNEEALQCQRV